MALLSAALDERQARDVGDLIVNHLLMCDIRVEVVIIVWEMSAVTAAGTKAGKLDVTLLVGLLPLVDLCNPGVNSDMMRVANVHSAVDSEQVELGDVVALALYLKMGPLLVRVLGAKV